MNIAQLFTGLGIVIFLCLSIDHQYIFLDQQVLIDLLAKYTGQFTGLYLKGVEVREMNKLKILITAIQKEIISRKQRANKAATW